MKKLIFLSVFLLGMVFNASAVKILVAWYEVSRDCISYIIIVTEDDGELIGLATGQAGAGCGSVYIVTDPHSPNDINDLMVKYPDIEREIDSAYDEYKRE